MANKTRILIVEDQTSVAMMMVYLLAHAGCETEVATTGAEAVQLAKEGNADLITLDIDLPETSGFEICRHLKKLPRCFDTPIIFVTGRPHDEDRQRAFDLGAVDYIAKPFDAQNFASRILSYVKPGEISNCFNQT